jgi:hypothetical protein
MSAWRSRGRLISGEFAFGVSTAVAQLHCISSPFLAEVKSTAGRRNALGARLTSVDQRLFGLNMIDQLWRQRNTANPRGAF